MCKIATIVFVLFWVQQTHAQTVTPSSIDTPVRIRFYCAPTYISKSNQALFIIDNKKISFENLQINFFNVSNIENIKVYKPKDDSAKLYGQAARNGVCIIQIKQPVNWLSAEEIFRDDDKNPFRRYRNTLFIVDCNKIEPGKEFYLEKEIIKSIKFNDNADNFYLNKPYKRTIATTTSSKTNG